MGLLIFALLQKFPALRNLTKRGRVALIFKQDQTLDIVPYSLDVANRTFSWGKKGESVFSYVVKTFHRLKCNGLPVDVLVEGNSKNVNMAKIKGEVAKIEGKTVNVIEENPMTQQDVDLSNLCMDFEQKGEMLERRKYNQSFRDKAFLILIILGVAAAGFALVNSFMIQTQVLPSMMDTVTELRSFVTSNIAEGAVAGTTAAAGAVVNKTSDTDIVLPEGGS